MSIDERKRQKKLARKNSKRKHRLLAYKKAMQNAPIILEQEFREKMSEVILDFAQPLLEAAKTDEDRHKAIGFAVIAWNTSLFPPDKRQESINKAFESLSITDEREKKGILMVLEMMMERKSNYFSDIDRLIINYQITDTEDGLHLSVVSTLLG